MKTIKIYALAFSVLMTTVSCGNNNSSNNAVVSDSTSSYQDVSKNNVDNPAKGINDTMNKSNPVVDSNIVK